MKRFSAHVLIYSTRILGLGSMFLFLLFLFLGSFSIVSLNLTAGHALLLDAFLSMMFFLQHSMMIRRSFRERLSRVFNDVYFSAFYALSSGIAITVAMLLWQRVPASVASADGISYWLLRVLFFACLAGFHWGAKSLGSFDALGVKRVKRHLQGRETRAMPLTVKGAYRWVRHPLYFFTILMIWSCPVLTADRLLFNVIWTVWIIAATMMEERDLLAEFGDEYRSYQTQVPMIIPYRIPGRSYQEA